MDMDLLLIGELYYKILNEFPGLGVPIHYDSPNGYEIDVYYKDKRIQLYDTELYLILQAWLEELRNLNRTGSGHPDNIMRKFSVLISTKDAESPSKLHLDLDGMDLNQENVTFAVGEVRKIEDVLTGLTSEDTITASVKVTDDQDTTRDFTVSCSNVKRREITEVTEMLKTAFSSFVTVDEPEEVNNVNDGYGVAEGETTV